MAYLAEKFDTDRTYTEHEVNHILKQWHTYADWSSLRRDLIGYKFASRDRNGLEYRFIHKVASNPLIREYVDASDSSSLLVLLADFQDHLAGVDGGAEVHSFNSDRDIRSYLDKMLSDVESMNGKFFVIEHEGVVAGFIQGIIDPRDDPTDIMYHTTHVRQIEGWIGLVYVAPEFRSKGYGIRLIDAMKRHFKQNGCTRLKLSVAYENHNTIEFYRKYGFAERDIEMAMPI